MGGKWTKLEDPVTRFWGWVLQHPEGCWGWSGSLTTKGYGQLTIDCSRKIASRFSWEIHHGPIPDGMVVCHRCDNPPCCNPAHLFLGTRAENNRDRDNKGRQARGEASPRTKFDADQVLEIRRRVAAGQSMSSLARELNVRLHSIQQIVHRKTWKHI